jgi:hypothetical protein
MSDELKRLVELAERQEQRDIARSRYWRNVRWVLIVIFAVVAVLSALEHRAYQKEIDRIRSGSQ